MSADEAGELLARVLLRLDAIEARLESLEGGRTTSAARPLPVEEPARERARQAERMERVFEPVLSAPPPSVREPFANPSEAAQKPAHQHLETQVGLTWLNRIGVLTVVLGVAFFFRYAVDTGLIGETGRIILGVAMAFAALGLAELMWRRDHRIYAQGITGAGIAILYLSLYAAFAFYHLLPQPPAGLLMFVATMMAVALSLRYNAIAIAALGLIGGYLTPLLLNQDEDHPWTLFAYLFILAGGGMTLVRRKSWSFLEPLILGGSALVYLAWFNGRFVPGKEFVATVSILALYALFWQFGSRGGLMASQILAVIAIAAVWSGPEAQSLWITLLLSAAGLLASKRRSWPALSFAVFLLSCVSAILWRRHDFPGVPGSGLAALTFGFLLFLGFVFWCLISEIDSRVESGSVIETPEPYLGIVALDGLVYFAFCYSLLNPAFHGYLGALAAALAGIHLFAGWQLWHHFAPDSEAVGELQPPVLFIGIAILFLTLAVPIQFSAYRITMFWAIEGAVFNWIAARTGNRRFGYASAVMFSLACVRLYLFDAGMYIGTTQHSLLLNARLVTFLITGISLWLGARWMRKGTSALVLYVGGHLVVLCALMAETLDWASQRSSMGDPASIGTLSASVLLALYGIVLVVIGVTARSVVDRVLGLGLFAAVVLKLYLYDVWQLQQSFRVVAFVVLGVLLLAASFLYSRFRAALERLWAGNRTSGDLKGCLVSDMQVKVQ